MSKVITFSRTFPSYHPRKGEPTNFVEKVWMSFIDLGLISMSRCCELSRETGFGWFDMNNIRKCPFTPKGHTIRKGHRFKAGDYFSPRVWGNDINPKSGRKGPYHSKQIIIAPDIEVKKVWNMHFEWMRKEGDAEYTLYGFINDKLVTPETAITLADNDGLTVEDMNYWFAKVKHMEEFQIICWNEKVNYRL